MNNINTKLITSIFNANTEIHYNQYQFRNRKGEWVNINLKGKIKCPVLNTLISHQACSHIMEKETWPRGVDPNACNRCNCRISMSIKRFQDNKRSKEQQ